MTPADVRMVGLVGIGNIGTVFAEAFLGKGLTVVGTNKPDTRAFEAIGGSGVPTAAEVVAQAEIILCCLPNESAATAAYSSPGGLLAGLGPGRTILDLSSYTPVFKQGLADAIRKTGAVLVDGEVSGTHCRPSAMPRNWHVSRAHPVRETPALPRSSHNRAKRFSQGGAHVISGSHRVVQSMQSMRPEQRILRSASHWGAFRMAILDGRLVSVEPFEHDPAPTPLISAWPEMVTSPLRVAEPVVRRGWRHGDRGIARGDDTFEPIGWDEALGLVADELDRVRNEHGNAAIFGGSYGWSSAGRLHHARTLTHRFLNGIGGFTGQVTNYSYGAAQAFLPRVAGNAEPIGAALTDWDSIVEHCDTMLAFGGIAAKNWEVLSGGFGVHAYPERLRALAAARTQVINISPCRQDFPDGYPAEWMPIRPNTDTALLLALTQSIVADGRHDHAMLDRMTVGFDRFVPYLMGATDGVAKTPHWAAEITGIPADRITALARSLPGKRVMVTACWSLQRARHGEQPYWAAIALAAALGQIGLPGGGFAFGFGSSNAQGSPRYDAAPPGLPTGDPQGGLRIPVARVADLLLHPGETIRFNGADITYPDIRLVYWAGGNPFHHHQDLNRLRRAFRRPETVIVHEQFWTGTARHADIVLPATTTVERNDIGGSSRDPFILAMHQGIAPVGAARNDFDIFADLAARLGTEAAFTEGRAEMAWLRVLWSRIQERLARRGVAAPYFEEFWEKGYFQVPAPNRRYVMFAAFRADPEQARLSTPSGRIEIFSETIAAMNDPEQVGHPRWIDPEEWVGAPLAARFPLHLLTPQPARRLHSQMEASSHSRAGKRHDREIVLINRLDAAPRGIETGNMVRLFNARGACLASAEVSDDILPGVLSMPTGAGFDPDGTGLDRSSNPNVLTRDIGTSRLGQGCAAQSCLVEIERYDDPLPPLGIFSPPPIA